jgi:chemotaxis response regulator CheB
VPQSAARSLVEERPLVSPLPVRVLVLYSHPLMGEGLERMLAAEQGVTVDAVDVGEAGAVDEALAREPAVIVVEEGGVMDAADIMRRSNCPIVLDVDITTSQGWTLRRETLPTRPDDFLATIRLVVGCEDRSDAGQDPPRMQPAPIPG